MNVLIKKARIICPESGFHNQVKDILIVAGIIQQINDNISAEAQIIESPNLHVSIGWMDLWSHFCDPGFEFRETLESGAKVAAAGGFTDIMVIPNTQPTISSKTQVEYIIQKSKSLPVNIFPIGSVSKNAEGKELAEMYDMHAAGAIAFSDGLNTIQNANLMIKALQYVLACNATIIQIPDEKSISTHGLINEGVISTQLGLPGKPAIAEELMIARDIELLKYTGSKLHITGISTRKSISMIEEAKNQGINISCSTTPYHAYFCDEDLVNYDTNLKLNPPLRTREDMMAIKEAIANGTIDCIASHHTPLHWDDKTCEFEYAKYGMIGLESLFGIMNTLVPNLELLIKQLTNNPRVVTGLPIPEIKTGAAAQLTIFDPTLEYVFTEDLIQSKSKNTPFINKKLKGKVIGIINKNQLTVN